MENGAAAGAEARAGERRVEDGRVCAIAAPWHTLAVMAVVLSWAYLGALTMQVLRAAPEVHLVRLYARSVATEWVVLAFVLWGVQRHGSPRSIVLGKEWGSVAEFARDCGRALLFWLGSIVLLGMVALLLRMVPHAQTVSVLLPHTPLQRLLWVGVAISAGICEEAIFRGYLQRQFLALTQSAPAAIALNAVIFGAVHLYQGWQGMIVIGMLGALLGTLAHWRGTVRTGMVAHAWQDTVAGILGGVVRG
jgi:membrane protease YdiL (CAAX protease family)